MHTKTKENNPEETYGADMYREHILDLYQEPPNFGNLEKKTHSHRSHNPLCGDEIEIQVYIEDQKIKEVKFKGKGCAISIASAALLTEKIKKMELAQIKKLGKKDILNMLQIPISSVRLKCALICLEALHKAINK